MRYTRAFGTAAVVLSAGCFAGIFLHRGAAAAAPPRLAVQQTETYLVVFAGGRPVLQYRYDCSPYKPYIKELFTPAGVQVLRDAPADHLHHHGLMFAVAADGVTFWAETARSGRQVQRALGKPQVHSDGQLGRVTLSQELAWLGPEQKEPLLTERRTIEVYAAADLPATLLTWRTQLRVGPGREQVKLTGHHYYGLGMRFAQWMDRIGRFANAAGQQGEVVRGQERLVRAKWCVYVVPDERHPVSAALFDHPDNMRHPAVMFTMPEHFAYLSATLNLWREPLTLVAGEPLELAWGVAVWDGQVEAAAVEQLYGRWLKLVGSQAGR